MNGFQWGGKERDEHQGQVCQSVWKGGSGLRPKTHDLDSSLVLVTIDDKRWMDRQEVICHCLPAGYSEIDLSVTRHFHMACHCRVIMGDAALVVQPMQARIQGRGPDWVRDFDPGFNWEFWVSVIPIVNIKLWLFVPWEWEFPLFVWNFSCLFSWPSGSTQCESGK